MQVNRIMLADSYKHSQPYQYPPNSSSMFSYLEARGGVYPETVFFGLQYTLQEYFSTPITKAELEEAAAFAKAHGEPFDYEGWQYIIDTYQGNLPIHIKAVPEGSLIPVSHPLVTIESTDSNVFWVTSFLETLLMKIWYPTTIATKSYYIKQMLQSYMVKYSDNTSVDFMYHNFGDRGASSVEAAAIGGVAHLTQFLGTDNFHALKLAKTYYSADCAGFSIPASEHSTVTSWGKDNEYTMIDNYLEKFKTSPIIACVMDSYDIYEAVNAITSGTFKQKIESPDYPIFVIRPDSGDPVTVITNILTICSNNNVAYTTNSKGCKVMNKYRIIYGDGITPETIEKILNLGIEFNFAPDNFAFGSGGDLMQNVNRDTCKFAIKCSSITVDNTKRDVFKNPITDPGKQSKKGRISTFKDTNGSYSTQNLDKLDNTLIDVLRTVYINGQQPNKQTLGEIRDTTTSKNNHRI